MNPDFLLPGNYEFFVENGELMYFENGVQHPFDEIPDPVFDILQRRLYARPKAVAALHCMGIIDPFEMVRQHTICNNGDFNKVADIAGNRCNDQEYYDCGKRRGGCKFEGQLCERIEAPYGMLSSTELTVLHQITLDKSDKEIADSLFLSRMTVSTHIRNMIAKTGTSSRVGLAMFAAKLHL